MRHENSDNERGGDARGARRGLFRGRNERNDGTVAHPLGVYGDQSGPAAERAVTADVVPGLVARPWRKLRKAVKALPADPTDPELHRIRILAKRARYAAEAAPPR